jgi:hypothetical protein
MALGRANQHLQDGWGIGRSFVRIWAEEKNRVGDEIFCFKRHVVGAGVGLHFYVSGAHCHTNDM